MRLSVGLATIFVLLLFALAACAVGGPDPPTVYVPGTAETGEARSTPTITARPTLIPDRDPTPTQPGCASRTGLVQGYEVPWQGETLRGRIYTPPCYGLDPDRNYPVLYLLHGAAETDQQWDDLGIDELADSLIDQGRISPLVIVMPREKTWLDLRENPFGDQLVQAVVPWVEGNFQTLSDRHHRAVGGLSRGGNWAIRLGLVQWGFFGSLGGHSAPLFFGDLTRVPGWLEAIPEDAAPRIYLDISEGDKNLQEALAFRDLLLKAGLDPDWHLNPGLHDQAYWQSHLEDYLLWYSAGWDDG